MARETTSAELPVLALDVGNRRIGLAISSPLGGMAVGLDTLHRTRIREDLSRLKAIAGERGVRTLLVGRPLHMTGDESRQSEYTREFAERVAAFLELPLIYWDERLTSAEAERLMRDSDASLEQRKRAVDQMAAVLILESFLEFRSITQTNA